MTANNQERMRRCSRLMREIAASKDPLRAREMRDELSAIQKDCPHTGVETILRALTEACPICFSPRSPLLPKR